LGRGTPKKKNSRFLKRWWGRGKTKTSRALYTPKEKKKQKATLPTPGERCLVRPGKKGKKGRRGAGKRGHIEDQRQDR